MSEQLEEKLGILLREWGWNIAVAETTTGGLISARIVSVPGSSAYYERGVIAYSALSKCEMLKIDEKVMDTYGAVSVEAACAMAKGVRNVSGADLGLAETGIAGPIRGRSPKPIGTAYIAVAGAEGVVCEVFQFDGDRDAIRNAIADAALKMVIEAKKTIDNR
ncbi:MAG: CinA family protein [Gemmatimonadetes bacterium]|nr:CinA family protein [Gemmatimonadota bacterium]